MVFLLGIFLIYAIGASETSVVNNVRMAVTALQFLSWCFSDLILLFEYRRALGHIWYMHPTFIWLSVAIYTSDLVYTFTLADHSTETINYHVLLGLIAGIMICSISVGILVCVYPNDLPFERRNYMAISNAAISGMGFIRDNTSDVSGGRSSSCAGGDPLALEKKQK